MRQSNFESQLDHSTLSLAEDGVLRITNKPGAVIGQAQAEEIMQTLLRILKVTPIPLFVDGTQIRSMDRKARRIFAGPRAQSIIKAQAILTRSPIARMIGSFFLGINRPSFPIRLFTEEDTAIDWLKGHLSP